MPAAMAAMVKELSESRANSVKQALVNKYKTLDPKQFSCVGMGWDSPADQYDKLVVVVLQLPAESAVDRPADRERIGTLCRVNQIKKIEREFCRKK